MSDDRDEMRKELRHLTEAVHELREGLRHLTEAVEALTPELVVSEPEFCTECSRPEDMSHAAGCSRPWQRMQRDLERGLRR